MSKMSMLKVAFVLALPVVAISGSSATERMEADDAEHLISMTYCADTKGIGYALARTKIVSDRERVVYAAAGCDWWWRAFVNGKEAVPFTEGFKPKAFPLHLKKGENEILLAFHCGMGSHFARFFDNLP